MTKWPLRCCLLIIAALALGACSMSSDSALSQLKLAGRDNDMCEPASGAATGMAALNGAQAAYADCMQDRSAARQFGSGGGRFAPGSNPASLAEVGQ